MEEEISMGYETIQSELLIVTFPTSQCPYARAHAAGEGREGVQG